MMEPSTKKLTEAQAIALHYVDQPECRETFTDCIHSVVFDGQTLRLEFGVTRLDEIKPNMPVTGRRYPACRLVMPPAAAIELIKRMQQVASALTQPGMAKPATTSVA